MPRPSWDEYFMQIAEQVGGRATCMRRHVGAVLVKDKRILATGYNGPPSGVRHCEEVGCIREKLGIPSGEKHELCRGIHAEQNAVIQAAKHGIPIDGVNRLLHASALPDLRQDPAERRHRRDRLSRAVSRSALRGAARRGGRRSSAVRAIRGGRPGVSLRHYLLLAIVAGIVTLALTPDRPDASPSAGGWSTSPRHARYTASRCRGWGASRSTSA